MPRDNSISLLELTCNSILYRLKKWCVANKLQINSNNSVLIRLSFKINDFFPEVDIACDDVILTRNSSLKYFRIITDSKLNFQLHLRMIKNKLASTVGMLRKVCFLFPPPL